MRKRIAIYIVSGLVVFLGMIYFIPQVRLAILGNAIGVKDYKSCALAGGQLTPASYCPQGAMCFWEGEGKSCTFDGVRYIESK